MSQSHVLRSPYKLLKWLEFRNHVLGTRDIAIVYFLQNFRRRSSWISNSITSDQSVCLDWSLFWSTRSFSRRIRRKFFDTIQYLKSGCKVPNTTLTQWNQCMHAWKENPLLKSGCKAANTTLTQWNQCMHAWKENPLLINFPLAMLKYEEKESLYAFNNVLLLIFHKKVKHVG